MLLYFHGYIYRHRSNREKYRFNDIRNEHSSIDHRYMNGNSGAFMLKVHLFDDVLMCGECRFRTNDINEFADHKSRKCSNTTKPPSEPESIQCCENTFESSWKLLQHLTDKHNLNLYRDASTTDDSQERRGTQTPSPLSSKSVKSEQNHPTTLIMNGSTSINIDCLCALSIEEKQKLINNLNVSNNMYKNV
uniref:C2H2-type domain-containing protein n=1 Tax=Panagrolaimus sp. PS1159 TaxID=55785 RepID=A0AC35GWX1_9BILA